MRRTMNEKIIEEFREMFGVKENGILLVQEELESFILQKLEEKDTIIEDIEITHQKELKELFELKTLKSVQVTEADNGFIVSWYEPSEGNKTFLCLTFQELNAKFVEMFEK